MSTITITPNYKPHAKQMQLHNAPVSVDDIWVILFGGSRGGGKSAGILADAFMFASTYPGAKCCILRESLDAVKQSFLDKLPTLFPQEVYDPTSGKKIRIYEYREKSTSWYPSRSVVFPNGSYITFQRVADYREAKQKQGWEFNYLAIDEVTKQDEETFDYLLTCVRSALIPNKYTNVPYQVPTKVVCGANPGGKGHKWVKQRFIDKTVTSYDPVHNSPLTTKDHVEVVQHPTKPNVKIVTNIRFIPSSHYDNPFLADSYVASLLAQPDHMVKMDLWGDWDIVAGKMFDLSPDQIIPRRMTNASLEDTSVPYDVYISVDWGFRPSYHSAQWHAVFADKQVLTFKEIYGQDLIFEDFVRKILEESEGFEIEGTCLPHDMFRGGDNYRNASGRIMGETKAEVFDYYGLNPMPIESGKGKVQMRFDKLQSATRLLQEDGKYRFTISEHCENLLDEFDHAVYDEFNPGLIAKGSKDHALDAYGLFLIFYSDDISPIGMEAAFVDNRGRLQRQLDEEEEYLNSLEEDTFIAIDDYWDL